MKLITLNIEGDRHLERFLPFLKTEKASVVCLQEVFWQDLTRIEKETGLKAWYVPTLTVDKENKFNIPLKGPWGVAILTDLSVKRTFLHQYAGKQTSASQKIFTSTEILTSEQQAELPKFDKPNSTNRVVLGIEVEEQEKSYKFFTTHFTWSTGGDSTPEQLNDFRHLWDYLQQFEEVILSGDFNAPRGGEIFAQFAKQLQDNLPPEVTTTLDENLHYAGKLELAVDTIFSTSQYQFQNVRVQAGVSDHLAVIGVVSKA